MIGAHELLLIIRGQNQASAAIGRVANDLRKLQAQRDLRLRQMSQMNQIQNQVARIGAMDYKTGTKGLALARAQNQLQRQREAISRRSSGLDQRRAAIASRANSITRQEERIKRNIIGLDDKALGIELKQLKAQQDLAATQAKIASLSAGIAGGRIPKGQPGAGRFAAGTEAGIGRQQAELAAARANTGVLRAQLQRDIIAKKARGALPGSIAGRRLTIAQENVTNMKTAAAIASRSVEQLDVAIADLQKTEARQMGTIQQLNADTARLAEEEALLKQELTDQNLKWAQLNERTRAVIATEQQHKAQLVDITERLKANSVAIEENSAAITRENEKLTIMKERLLETNAAIANQKWENLANAARGVDHLGRVLQMFGLISTAVFGAAAKQAADFATASTLAATQLRKPGQGQAATAVLGGQIGNQVLKQMDKFPASAQEMNDAFYQIFSGTNVKGIKDASQLLGTFNKMAVAGGADLKTMTEAGITIRNNFPNDFKSMADAANYFASAVRYGRMTYQQFGAALPTVAATAKTVGLGFRDIANDLAFLTRQTGGARTAQDATGLARLYQLMIRPDFVRGFKTLGVSVVDAGGKMRPMVKIISDLVRLHPNLAKSPALIANLFKQVSAAGGGGAGTQGTIQARRTFDIMVQGAKTYNDIVHKVSTTQGQFNKDYAALAKSPGVQWKVFTNQLKAFFIILGQGAIPAIAKASRPLVRFIHYLEGLSPHTQRAIGYFGLLVSALTLLGGTVMVIVGGFASMAFATKGLLGWIAKLGGKGGAMEALAGESGKVSIKLLAMRLGLLSVFIIAGPVLNRLIGLKETIILLTTAMTAFQFSRWIAGMRAVTASAVEANGAAVALRATLLSLIGMGVITVVIEAIIHRKQLNRFLDKQVSRIPVVGKPLANLGGHLNDKEWQKLNKLTEPQLEDYIAKFKAAGGGGIQLELLNKILNKKFPLVGRANGPASQHADADIKAAKTKYAQWAKAHPHLDPLTGRAYTVKFTNANVIAAVKNINRLQAIAEKARPGTQAAYKAWDAYEKALTSLQSHASKDQMAVANDLLGQQSSATKKAHKKALADQKKHNKDMLNEAAQNYKTMVSTLQQTFQTFQSANQSQLGTLFSGPFVNSPRTQNNLQWGGKLTGKDLLTDLKSQVSKYRQFRDVLDKLSARGVPYELLMQIHDMGPDALDNARALLSLNKKDFTAYTAVFKRGKSLVDRATKVDMSRQLKHWRTFGSDIAKQILLGLKDENSPLESYFRGMLTSLGVAPKISGPGGQNKQYVQYIYHGGTMSYSAWLRKSKNHHKNR